MSDNNEKTFGKGGDSSSEHDLDAVIKEDDESVETDLPSLRYEYNIIEISPNSEESPKNEEKNNVVGAQDKKQEYVDSLKRSRYPENHWDTNLGGPNKKHDSASISPKLETIEEKEDEEEEVEDIDRLYESWKPVKRSETTGSSEQDESPRDSETDAPYSRNRRHRSNSNPTHGRRRSPEPTRFRPELVTLQDILDLKKPENGSFLSNSSDTFPGYPNWNYSAALPADGTRPLFHYPLEHPPLPTSDNEQEQDEDDDENEEENVVEFDEDDDDDTDEDEDHEQGQDRDTVSAEHDHFGSPAKRARHM